MNKFNTNINALTFDVEDWYQGFKYRGIEGWEKFGSREKRNVDKILNILDKYNAKATFFILGNFAETNSELIKLIFESGHEIASHSYSHIHVPKLTQKEFREDVKKSKSILEEITGDKVIGYRAPSWSINTSSYWALDILSEENFIYDSSLFPSSFHPFGNNKYQKFPSLIELPSGHKIFEFPAQVLSIGSINLPVAGGFYLRALPFIFSKLAITQSVENKYPAMVYLHPYDLDSEIPKLKTSLSFKIIRYYRLKATEKILENLLHLFKFGSIKSLITADKF